ncbi:MAG TPA: VWA-like domain-containing protein [Lentisphaeria bacterium]|nr:MAG: hypothetical protein BWX73_00708 [Lentisphaerae bacterium ADurb.Bin082]HPY90742.1 VWA-like domain-containing protein [Lentisphaeria bacterium]
MTISDADVQAELERLSALRMQMLEMHPFWGYLLLQVKLTPALDLPAFAATDYLRHIWFNPARTRLLNAAQLGFVLAHEICHQVFATSERARDRDPFLWNLAADFAINLIVADITVPGGKEWKKLYEEPEIVIPGYGKIGILLDEDFRGMIAETIYEHLRLEEEEEEEEDGEGHQGRAPQMVTFQLPDQQGVPRQLPDILDHQGGIDIHLPLDLTVDMRETLQARIRDAIGAWSAGDRRGDLPSNLLTQLGLLNPPQIPWQRLFHRFADAAVARDDYSLARPNRRYLAMNLIVPGRYQETLNRVVIALDTSASMDKEELRDVASEIVGMMPLVDDITLIVADAAIQEVVPFEGLESFLRAGRLPGRGGTDHVCVFDYIAEHRLNPSLFIGLTDLGSSFPEQKPPYPVLWVTPHRHAEAPWGQVIALPPRPD